MASSRSLGTLTLDLVAKTGGFVAGMDKGSREAVKFKRKVKRELEQVGRAFKVMAAAGVVGAAAVVAATIKQENAIAQLDARLKSTGGVAGKTSKELQAFASSLQKVTTFGDETIVEMQALLLTFTNIRGEIFDQTVPAILNVATAMKTDLKSAAIQVGKALNDPARGLDALSRSGITFSEEQKKAIKALQETGKTAEAQTLILKELETQFGGAAEAAAGTLGGSLLQLKNAFGDLLEADGGLEDNTAAVKAFVALLQDPKTIAAASQLTNAIISSFSAAAKVIRETIGLTKFLSEELASIAAGVAADDFARLTERAAALELQISRLSTSKLAGLFSGSTNKLLASLRAELAQVQTLIDFALDPNVLDTTASGKPPAAIAAVKDATDDVVDSNKENLSLLQDVVVTAKEWGAANDDLYERAGAYRNLVSDLRTDEEKLTDQMRERFAVLEAMAGLTDEEKNKTASRIAEGAFGDAPEYGGLAPEVGGAAGELVKINAAREALEEWYAEKLGMLDEQRQKEAEYNAVWDEQELELKQEHEDKLAAIEQARQQVQLAVTEDLFGNLADITRQFAGEQSGIFKAMFVVQKAAAIAQSLVAIQAAIAQAATAGPFPANLAAMGIVAAQTASIIGNIQAVSMAGQAHDGMDFVPRTGTFMLEKGERVTTAETSAKLDKTLSDVRSNLDDRMTGGGRNLRIVNAFDTGVIGDYLGSSDGEEIIMNAVRRNERTIRSLSA